MLNEMDDCRRIPSKQPVSTACLEFILIVLCDDMNFHVSYSPLRDETGDFLALKYSREVHSTYVKQNEGLHFHVVERTWAAFVLNDCVKWQDI